VDGLWDGSHGNRDRLGSLDDGGRGSLDRFWLGDGGRNFVVRRGRNRLGVLFFRVCA